MKHNPWWDHAKSHAKPGDGFRWSAMDGDNPLEIGGLRETGVESWTMRRFGVGRWSWSVTDPDTVEFVAKYSRGQMIDPLAGTGYWEMLLNQLGVDVYSSDLNPPAGTDHMNNHWHPNASQFVKVEEKDAVDAVRWASPSRTLFLSWIPYGDLVGYLTLDAYQGERVIVIGEGEGGCTAEDEFFQLLDREWEFVAGHRPVQFFGIHDYVTVFDRKRALPQQ